MQSLAIPLRATTLQQVKHGGRGFVVDCYARNVHCCFSFKRCFVYKKIFSQLVEPTDCRMASEAHDSQLPGHPIPCVVSSSGFVALPYMRQAMSVLA